MSANSQAPQTIRNRNINWCSHYRKQYEASLQTNKKPKTTELPYGPGFPGGASGKNPPASAGDVRDVGSIPGLRSSPGGGHGNPLQCSCLAGDSP